MGGDSNIHFRSAAGTHAGTVRRLNEDSYLDRADLGLWAVADGMGGHEAGDYASQCIINALHELDPPDSAPTFLAAVSECLNGVNRHLRETAAGRGAVIGSTVVVLLIFDGHYAALWAGDSRLYLLRNGALQQLSHDHSQVQELVDAGVLSAEEAERHPASSIITRAIGVTEDVQLDMLQGAILPNDIFLLCSDGLVKALPEAQIAEILRDGPTLETSAASLVEQALAHHASDNVTAVLIEAKLKSEAPT